MIFCTVGNDTHEFRRFSDYVLRYASDYQDKVFVFQHGHTDVVTDLTNVHLYPFFSRDEFKRNLKDCEALFCHAGAGTLGTAKSLGVIPLILPRLKSFNEHVDNHQLDIFSAYLEQGWGLRLEEFDVNEDYTRNLTDPDREQLIESLKETIGEYVGSRNL